MGTWRPEIGLPLLLASSAFGAGWWRLSRRSPRPLPAWRLASALGGLVAIDLALLSPLDELAHGLFAAHMVQHLLLVMGAPPLLLLADPLPMVLWALPKRVRLAVGSLLTPGALLRRTWQVLTWMPVAWLVSTLTLWLWHLPVAYEAALRGGLLHDVEHLAFFWTGVLFWWPIVSPAPRLHGFVPYSWRIVYAILADGQHALLGLLLSISPVVLYPFYDGHAPWSVSPLDDQARGGVIMWATSSLVGVATVMVLIYRLLEQEERRSSTPTRLTVPPGACRPAGDDDERRRRVDLQPLA